MISANSTGDDSVLHFVTKAIDLGAKELEVEFENHREHIYAVGEHSCVEIASLESNCEPAISFLEKLFQISEQPRKITVSGSEYKLKVKIHESFGESVYHVTFKKV